MNRKQVLASRFQSFGIALGIEVSVFVTSLYTTMQENTHYTHIMNYSSRDGKSIVKSAVNMMCDRSVCLCSQREVNY